MCVPISREDLLKGPQYVYKHRERSGKGEHVTYDGEELLNLKPFEVQEKVRTLKKVSANGLSGSVFIPEVEHPPCIALALKKTHPDHWERYLLTTYFHKIGSFGSYELTPEQEEKLVQDLIAFYSTLKWGDWNLGKTTYQVNNIIQEKYRKPACGWIMSNNGCPGLCGYYRE